MSVILVSLFICLVPSTALADTTGTMVSGIGSQCSNDTMGMSNIPAHTSMHKGYRLDYRASVSDTESMGNTKTMVLAMGLSDAGMNQTITFATYVIKISKVNYTASGSTGGPATIASVMGSNVFLAREGNLTLNLKSIIVSPGNPQAQASKEPIIYGDQDPVLSAYVADPGHGITIGNLQIVAGAYRAHVELFGVDAAQCIFSSSDTPKFDVYWKVDSNGSVTPLNSSVVPEFGLSQVILALSVSGVVGFTLSLRLRRGFLGVI